MTSRSSRAQVTVAVLDGEPDASPMVTCLLCHTPASLTQHAIDAGTGWQCVRCGQRWDATRLAAVAAYAVWVDERTGAGAKRAQRTVLSHHVPLDGKT
jgi:hypothetical protein